MIQAALVSEVASPRETEDGYDPAMRLARPRPLHHADRGHRLPARRPRALERGPPDFEDPVVRYLFDPAAVHAEGNAKVVADVQRHRLSKKPGTDAGIGQQAAISFLNKWGGDPRSRRRADPVERGHPSRFPRR